ncbi:MAG: hypothetical protein AB1704_20285 [Pseudomonadota bacterium]
MSNDFTNKTVLCTVVIVCPLLAFLSHADGHTSWPVAAWQAIAVAIAALAVIFAPTFVIALIAGVPLYIAKRKQNRMRVGIEQRFPGTRATYLKSGNWLLTEQSTGHTRCELERDGATRACNCDLPSEAGVSARPSDDTLWDQTLHQRDHYHDQADKLAAAIANHLGVDIGEHSNIDFPWANALEAIESAPPIDQGQSAGAYRTYPGSNHEIIEKALYCNQHGDTESVENWLEHLRSRLTLAPAISLAAADVISERLRQQDVEGWTPENDDSHAHGALARAAAYYARASFEDNWQAPGFVPPGWPLSPAWWKPGTSRRNLEKAAALILAEMDRLDRAEPLHIT